MLDRGFVGHVAVGAVLRAEGSGAAPRGTEGKLKVLLSKGWGGGGMWLSRLHSRSEQVCGVGLGSTVWVMTSLFSCQG